MTRRFRIAAIALLLAQASVAFAADPPKLDPANTAWMLTSSVLVLFMTLPGLALFYGGLVRAKNVLSIAARSTPGTADSPRRSYPGSTQRRSRGAFRKRCSRCSN